MRKNERLLSELGGINESYVAEAMPKSTGVSRANKRKRIGWISAVAACLALAIAIPIIALFGNFGGISQYEDSPYYSIIKKIDAYAKEQYDRDDLGNDMSSGSDFGSAPESGEGGTYDDLGSYVEITDNQVNGIVEADVIKRTDKYIFHLFGSALNVYSINGELSEMLASYNISYELVSYDAEMYLSPEDGAVTVIASGQDENYRQKTVVIALDVSDLDNICEVGRATVDGKYISSRLVDGRLMVMTEFYFNYKNADYANPETFIPTVRTQNGRKLVPMQNILCPENITSTRYTVVMSFDNLTLGYLGSGAFLSYSDTVYVSENAVYATRGYIERKNEGNRTYNEAKTVISIMSYKNGEHSVGGSITVSGSVLNRFSLDEYDGMLRVVTTVNKSSYLTAGNDSTSSAGRFNTTVNASLYVYDLKNLSLMAAVEHFAPEGETVQSVRFDKTEAYVCTSIQLSDPVFYFDLSDINNITSKDTGTITGFSSTLIRFGDFLLGIGRDSWSDVKIEVYEQTTDGVRSVDSYTVENADYSLEYKTYYINRSDYLLGICIRDRNKNKPNYVLLHFNGYELVELVCKPVDNSPIDKIRAFCDDEYLYILGSELIVVKYK